MAFVAIMMVVLAVIIMFASAEDALHLEDAGQEAEILGTVPRGCPDEVFADHICTLSEDIFTQIEQYHKLGKNDDFTAANNHFDNWWEAKLIHPCTPEEWICKQQASKSDECIETRWVSYAIFVRRNDKGNGVCTLVETKIIGPVQQLSQYGKNYNEVKSLVTALLNPAKPQPNSTGKQCECPGEGCDPIDEDECTSSEGYSDSCSLSEDDCSCQGSSSGNCCPKVSKRSSDVSATSIGGHTVNISTGDSYGYNKDCGCKGKKRGERPCSASRRMKQISQNSSNNDEI